MARRPSAELAKRRRMKKTPTIGLDSLAARPGRGRRPRVAADLMQARSQHLRRCLDQVWSDLAPRLFSARSAADVRAAFESDPIRLAPIGAMPSWYPVIPRILRERTFPKTRDAQIKFFADSLAGWGEISPRRSRDLCAEARSSAARATRILRYELYVVCSCGYEGPSLNHACQKCGAQVEFKTE
jgi:hypothetical protein